MGLTGLAVGGFPPHNNNIASIAGEHRVPYGTRAIDSSGGQWMYAKASTAAIVGSVVFCAPGADPWQATVTSTAGFGISTVQGTMLGVQNCTANSTTQDCWIQTNGPMSVLVDSTAFAAGASLFLSTSVAGSLSVTTTGARVFGTYLQSSGGAGLAAPVLASVNAPNGLIVNIA